MPLSIGREVVQLRASRTPGDHRPRFGPVTRASVDGSIDDALELFIGWPRSTESGDSTTSGSRRSTSPRSNEPSDTWTEAKRRSRLGDLHLAASSAGYESGERPPSSRMVLGPRACLVGARRRRPWNRGGTSEPSHRWDEARSKPCRSFATYGDAGAAMDILAALDPLRACPPTYVPPSHAHGGHSTSQRAATEKRLELLSTIETDRRTATSGIQGGVMTIRPLQRPSRRLGRVRVGRPRTRARRYARARERAGAQSGPARCLAWHAKWISLDNMLRRQNSAGPWVSASRSCS